MCRVRVPCPDTRDRAVVELNISDNDLGDTGMERIGRAIQDKGGAPLTTLLTQRVGMSDKVRARRPRR